jgi:hypothetical protein
MNIGRVLGVCLILSIAAVAAEPRVEAVSGPPAAAPKAIAEALQSAGNAVLGTDGNPVAQIWLRKDVPVSGKKDVEGANYPAIAPGVFLGVITFPAQAKDFRGQPIKSGTYSMRYALLPNDGNHMGVAPDRDFVLLVSAADDPGPSNSVSYDDLVKLSSRAAGTSHPAAFSMPAPPSRALPAAYTDANEYVIFAGELATATGKLPVALIVKGISMSF